MDLQCNNNKNSKLYLHDYYITAMQKRRIESMTITVISYQGTIATLMYIITFIHYSKKSQINFSLISKHNEMNKINRRFT